MKSSKYIFALLFFFNFGLIKKAHVPTTLLSKIYVILVLTKKVMMNFFFLLICTFLIFIKFNLLNFY